MSKLIRRIAVATSAVGFIATLGMASTAQAKDAAEGLVYDGVSWETTIARAQAERQMAASKSTPAESGLKGRRADNPAGAQQSGLIAIVTP
ncbi:MAG: hypothetical protein HYU77_01620 [Betaproteobacteria bacterium]|nr:hypothetical protein [Betaproteobacteria bacterium]